MDAYAAVLDKLAYTFPLEEAVVTLDNVGITIVTHRRSGGGASASHPALLHACSLERNLSERL